MNCSVIFDWKMFLALGGAAAVIIFASKIDGSSAERVLSNEIDACKDVAVAFASGR